MKKAFFFFAGFYILVLGFVYANVFIHSRQEYAARYYFVISKIEVESKGNLVFYDSLKNKYSFSSYRFSKGDKSRVLVGDKVFKDSCSKKMIISRRINGKYEICYIQNPNGIIPFSFYSK